MLLNVPEINQQEYLDIQKANIRYGMDTIILGPSGGGKTFIAKEAADAEDCQLIYINLSVMERTDLQGFPIVSEDQTCVTYATPAYLPFSDSATRNEKTALQDLIQHLDEEEYADVFKWASKRLAELETQNNLKRTQNAQQYLQAAPANVKANFEKLITTLKGQGAATKPIVILFDEVDKAATETCQTLLEFIQFKSVNGRKLNVKACILTGNLPDEHAHTNQISHAITKRCQTYKMSLDFNIWRVWAFRNDVHDLIIQFLSSNITDKEGSFFYRTAKDDNTEYALPSPRTWTAAGQSLSMFEKDPAFNSMKEERKEYFMLKIIAGSVGEAASQVFHTWYKHFRKFEPQIQDLILHGKHPNTQHLRAEEILIIAIAACSKMYSDLKTAKNTKSPKLIQTVKNVYGWMDTVTEEIAMGAIRISFGGDFDLVNKFGLANVPEFNKVFQKLNEKIKGLDQV